MTNKNKINISEDSAILNSLGLTNSLDEELNNSPDKTESDRVRNLFKEYNNLSYLMSLAVFSDKLMTPGPELKEKLFEKLNLKIKSDSISEPSEKRESFEFIFSDSTEWMPHPEIKGLSIKPLSLNKEKGYLVILLKAAAGCVYPSHHHSGAEECYVLEGDLFVEGKHLGPGDFHHAEGESDHEPLRTKNGCTLLLVVDPRDY